MMCQNCGKFEANIKYRQMKNGKVEEFRLCDDCAMNAGINSEMIVKAIAYPNIITELLGGYESKILNRENFLYNKEDLDYEDIYEDDLEDFEEECKAIKDEITNFLNGVGGEDTEVYTIRIKSRSMNDKNTEEKSEESNEEKIKKLQRKMDLAVEEERYEDAAKFRDEISKLTGKE